MIKPLLLLVAVLGWMFVAWASALVADEGVVFSDDFDRANADSLGGEWDAKGDIAIKDKAAFFQLVEAEFRPRMKHTFPAQTEGKFIVFFVFDWLRGSEGNWAFYLQLGNSETMPKRLVYEHDLSKGIGVNLIWGSGELVGFGKAGTLGYRKGDKFHALTIVNDSKVKESVIDKPVVRIEVDVDASTFTLRLGDKAYPDLPFDTKGPVDTIRFIANGCSESGFSRSSIDEIVISKEK